MASFVANIIGHFKRLADFGGRESRGYFWPYAGSVIALVAIGTLAGMVGPITDSMRRVQEFAASHPDQVTIEQGPGHYSMQVEGHHPELMPDFAQMIASMGVVIAIAVLLLAAAVARRLHDRGRSGLWGLMPLPFLAFGLLIMPRVMAGDDMSLFFALFFNNLIYLGSLLTLVIMLAGDGQPSENRFGERST